MGVRETKKNQNRQQILQAARKVFSEKGYHKASISDIIRETGLSRGTFYLYYKDKPEIFRKLTASLYTALMADLGRLDLGPDILRRESGETFVRGIAALFRTLSEHRELVRILLNSPVGIDPEFDYVVEKYLNELYEATKRIILKGIEYDIITAENPDLIARVIYGGMKELTFQWLVKEAPDGDIESQIGQVVELFSRGLRLQ